ncbi:MAG TPA: capsule biosynthesis protein [Usitatibacter sp.]|jgi:capsular polysaccharide transport system permease protein|nr:capsule biosynthesis protein [Usitatibacter sp.]
MTWLRRHPLFLVIVAIPTLAALIYYGLIASDVYVSESRFVVRTPQPPLQAGLMGALLQGSPLGRSQDDAYSIHDYMLSRDALHAVDASLGVRRIYSDPHADFIDRFPGPAWWDDSFEALHRYWQKRVSVDFDNASSITVLRVRAFNAADAQRINDMLLQLAEKLVNDLNDRSRNDLIRFASGEVKVAEDRMKDAAAKLSSFRGKQALYEPDRQASLQLQGVAKINEELLSTEAQIAQLRQLSPNNPQIPSLVIKAETLRRGAAAENAKVTGGSGSFSSRAPDFERLALERTFADRQLATALAALETARSDAQRKQLYLERLVLPNLPDDALEPRRIRSILTILVLSLITWGVVSLLVASIREHAD